MEFREKASSSGAGRSHQREVALNRNLAKWRKWRVKGEDRRKGLYMTLTPKKNKNKTKRHSGIVKTCWKIEFELLLKNHRDDILECFPMVDKYYKGIKGTFLKEISVIFHAFYPHAAHVWSKHCLSIDRTNDITHEGGLPSGLLPKETKTLSDGARLTHRCF